MSLPPIKHCSMFTEKNDWSKYKKKQQWVSEFEEVF